LPDRIAFGSFELDLRQRVLLRHGVAVPLGSRAVDVLCTLALAHGDLVGKDRLIAQVWPDTVVEENNLQVQISSLRKAFAAEDGSRGWLQTVPGRGYRFVAPLRTPPAPVEANAPAYPARPPQAIEFVQATDGVHLAAAATGSGPALLRTGMWMTHLEHEWDAQVWGPLLGRLSDRFRLVRYDQRGMGMSDRAVPAPGFDTLVSDLAAVAQRMAPGRVALLGMTQGAPVAIEYAARHPDRVSCLVLLGGYAKGWRAHGNERVIASTTAFATLTRQGWGRQNPAFRQVFTSLAMPDATREEMDAYNELQRLSSSAQLAGDMLETVGDFDVSQRLAEVRLPTLVLHSEHDAWIPAALGRQLAQAIPGARFVSLPSSSHVPMPREPAWERMVGSIVDFVAAHGD
jgi:pimeloyl-ACP methyl ester carboxylesterase